MGTRKKILFATIIGVFLTLGVYNLVIHLYDLKLMANSTYNISIENKSNKTLEDLELRFYNGELIEKIEKIQPKKTWQCNLSTENISGESSVYLIYKDNKNNLQKLCIIGYLEKGYGGREKVKIKNINKDGLLEIE